MARISPDNSPSEGLDAEQQRRKAELVRKIQEGIDSLNRGEGIPGEVFEAKLNAKIAALRLEQ